MDYNDVVATYLSKMSPNADVHVAGGILNAKDGILLVYNEAHEAEIDALIAARPDWRQMFQKVDISAANKLARAHLMAARPQASRGASSSIDPAKQRHEASGDALRSAEIAGRQPPEPLQVIESDALSTAELGKAEGDPNAGIPVTSPDGSLKGLMDRLQQNKQ